MRDDEALVSMAAFGTVWEASMARGVLESAGIRAFVPEETLIRSRATIWPTATLQIFESDRARAIVELRRRQIRLVESEDESE